MFKSFWKFRLSIVWVNFAVIAVFAAAGYGIGMLAGNAKIGLIVGALVSFGPALAVTTKVVRRQAERMVEKDPTLAAPPDALKPEKGAEDGNVQDNRT